MFFKTIEKMSQRAFKRTKWLLTALSGALTTGFIFILES